MTQALKNYKDLKKSFAACNEAHTELHLRASEAKSQASNASVGANNLNALKGQRRSLLGLLHLGKTQETTDNLDLQIAKATSSLAASTDKFDGASAAAELIYAEAETLGRELAEMASQLPRLKYYAAVEMVDRLAMKYRGTVDTMLKDYVSLVAACRLVDNLCDPLKGMPALGSPNFANTIEIQTNSLINVLQSLNKWQHLNDHIQAAMPSIIADLEG
jgi:hypothetical protein